MILSLKDGRLLLITCVLRFFWGGGSSSLRVWLLGPWFRYDPDQLLLVHLIILFSEDSYLLLVLLAHDSHLLLVLLDHLRHLFIRSRT